MVLLNNLKSTVLKLKRILFSEIINKFIISIIAILLVATINPLKANFLNSYPDSISSIETIQHADIFDSLYFQSIFADEDQQINENRYGYQSEYIPTFSDSILQMRINEMNILSPFNYAFNQEVKAYINLYSNKRRGLISRMLVKGDYYFPLFEEMLDKYNLPLELKYLAVIESSLNPVAVSHAGAVGLWQFMPGTGRLYDLTYNKTIDERKNIYEATEAACRHFVDLYNLFHDWNLVLAAYNAGAGNVNKAIKKSGGKQTYWEIYDFLPRETRGYVPAFIAVNYVMTYHIQHNIYPAKEGFSLNNQTYDTVCVAEQLSFYDIARMANTDIETIKNLNPQYLNNQITPGSNKPMIITLPTPAIANFIRFRNDIIALETEFENIEN